MLMIRMYSDIKTVNLQRDAVLRADDFSKKVIATVNYADSNQTNLRKIRDDHFVSKLGEEAAKLVLAAYGEVSGPDYNIYEGGLKSWTEDLFFNKTGIAVKTQRRTNALKYTLSWTFQAGKARADTVLNKPDAWVIFVEYDDTHPYHCYVYPPFQIKELKFGEPKLQHLKGMKKVIYADSLPFSH